MAHITIDPDYQEELRQKQWDDFLTRCARCSACDTVIQPGQISGRITVRKEELIFCEDCLYELKESEDIFFDWEAMP